MLNMLNLFQRDIDIAKRGFPTGDVIPAAHGPGQTGEPAARLDHAGEPAPCLDHASELAPRLDQAGEPASHLHQGVEVCTTTVVLYMNVCLQGINLLNVR